MFWGAKHVKTFVLFGQDPYCTGCCCCFFFRHAKYQGSDPVLEGKYIGRELFGNWEQVGKRGLVRGCLLFQVYGWRCFKSWWEFDGI